MNIIIRELKSNLKGLIIWFVSLSLIFYAASFEYEAFAGSEEVARAMEQFDFLFRAMVGASVDITSPEGYLSLVSLYIYLPLGIYSGLLGSNLISKEERDKTAEYLFTLPVKRSQVLTSKLITGVIYSVILNVTLLTVTYFAFGRLGTSASYNQFVFNMALGVLLTQAIFYSIGALLSAVLRQYKRSGAITIAVLMSTYMMSVLTGLTSKLDFLKYFTPFKYFDVNKMLNNDWQFIYFALTILIVVSSITGVFYFYKKRDLYI